MVRVNFGSRYLLVGKTKVEADIELVWSAGQYKG